MSQNTVFNMVFIMPPHKWRSLTRHERSLQPSVLLESEAKPWLTLSWFLNFLTSLPYLISMLRFSDVRKLSLHYSVSNMTCSHFTMRWYCENWNITVRSFFSFALQKYMGRWTLTGNVFSNNWMIIVNAKSLCLSTSNEIVLQ